MTRTAPLRRDDLPPLGDDEAPPSTGWSDDERLWSGIFLGLVLVALPLLVFHYGQHHWFLRDDWDLVVEQGGSELPDLMEPHGGPHWVAVPRLLYLGLWQLFGMTTYRPYQAVVVVMHLAVAVLLRAVMRRAGVGPLLATAAAGVFVLCGPGAKHSVWAFQVSFIGSLAWGLGHLLLADHDGPFDRRDGFGLALGFLAIASSGVGATTTVAVGIAVLLRRGWRLALIHTLPLAAVYLSWMGLADATTSSGFGRPTVTRLLDWLRDSVSGTLLALGRFTILGWALGAVLVVGLALLARRPRDAGAGPARVPLSMPLGLAGGALFFMVSTALGRGWGDFARSERYLYLEAALLLPLLAVAATAIAVRWRPLTPVLALLFLLPVPFNVTSYDEGVFDGAYMANQRRVLTTAVRMPFARDVPREVTPFRGVYPGEAVPLGFLLDAEADGKLTPSTDPLTPAVVNEFEVRLGVAQQQVPGRPTGCEDVPGPVDLDPARGDTIELASSVAISTVADGEATSRPVLFLSHWLNGTQLTIELPDLHLRISPAAGATAVRLCDARERIRPGEAITP